MPNLDVKPFDIVSWVDLRDIAIGPGCTERSYAAIEADVAQVPICSYQEDAIEASVEAPPPIGGHEVRGAATRLHGACQSHLMQ
jgi:hypothetical protein